MLTPEQTRAIVAPNAGIFIEAHPGSGKTTVAAERFGMLRFAPEAAGDSRAVVATSFTKAATRELKSRIARTWGPSAIRWPHRVVTVDTLLRDILVWLLEQSYVTWIGDRTHLDVRDSWKGSAATESTRVQPIVRLSGRRVVVGKQRTPTFSARPTSGVFRNALALGICTHDEVRAIVLDALQNSTLSRRICERLRQTMRALIIDEAFDANDLDVAFLDACLDADVGITIIGDPWQALYEFRGAQPAKVRVLTKRDDVSRYELKASFRWKSQSQATLTETLRASRGVELLEMTDDHVDVALAEWWKTLWEADNRILPIAFGAAKHDLAYAGATLVLGHVTIARFGGIAGPFLQDARSTLGIADLAVSASAEQWAEAMAHRLADSGNYEPKQAYADMAEDLGAIVGREFPPHHHSRSAYFKWLRPRLLSSDQVVLGMTIHQAKGQEWDRTGVVLTSAQKQALREGLQELNSGHRALYVACTRARISTSAWGPRDS